MTWLSIGTCLAGGLAAGYLGWAYFEIVSLLTRWALHAARRRPPGTWAAGLQAGVGVLAWIAYAIVPAAVIILAGPGSRRVRFLCLLGWYGGVFAGFSAYLRRPEPRLESWVRRLGRLYAFPDR